MKTIKWLGVLLTLSYAFCSCESTNTLTGISSNETVEFEFDRMSIPENVGDTLIPFILSGFLDEDVVLTLSVVESEKLTAKEGEHFILDAKDVKIVAGAGRAYIPLRIIDDQDVNTNRSFDLAITGTAGVGQAAISQVCRVTILNDDFWPVVSFPAGVVATTEHDDKLVIPLVAAGIFYQPVQATLVVNSGSAVEGTDFSISRKTFTFDENTTADSIEVTLLTKEIGNDITFGLALEIENGITGKFGSAKVVIKDVVKQVGFAKTEIPLLKNALEFQVPVAIRGVRSPRDLRATVKIKGFSGVQESDFELQNQDIVTKGDTVLFVTLVSLSGKWPEGAFVELEIDPEIEGGSLIPESQVTKVVVTSGNELRKRNWEVLSCNSFQSGNEAAKIIDGDNATFWQAKWSPAQTPSEKMPFVIVFDLKERVQVESLKLHRVNGDSKKIEIYMSEDNVNWTLVGTLEEASFVSHVADYPFEVTANGRYLKLIQTESGRQNGTSGDNLGRIGEIYLNGLLVPVYKW